MLSTLRSAGIPRRSLASAAAASSPPFLWKIAHGMFNPETPMSRALPGIPKPKEMSVPSPSAVDMSRLSNGVRVVSQDCGSAVAALGVFVGVGSRHENPYTSGSTQILEHVAFVGTKERSRHRITRDIERTGGHFATCATRETILYSAEVMQTNIADALRILADSATSQSIAVPDPSSAEHDAAAAEIASLVRVIKSNQETLKSDPTGKLTEAIHAVGYHGNTLGLPLMQEDHKLSQITPQSIHEFVSTQITPDRIVVAGANVNHKELVKLTEETLGSMLEQTSSEAPQAQYTGGSMRYSASGPSHFLIGFEGVPWSDPDLVPVCVLHALMGGGGSFSTGGPGKGMYTRLYKEVLQRHSWISSALAFNHCYSDSGLFGLHASCDNPDNLNTMIEVIGVQVARMADSVSADALQRAKNMTRGSLFMNLESRNVLCEDLGRQVLGTNKYLGPAELIKQIDAVDQGAIQRVANRLLSSKPSMVLHGDEFETPSFNAVEGYIKGKAKIAA